MNRTGPYEDAWQTPDLSDSHYSQSLARGLAIMECFKPGRWALGIADIAQELGMSRSTTYRYTATLVALGYMEQNKGRKYRLSLRVTDLGMSVLNSTGLRDHAHSILDELCQHSTFTASLAVLDGHEIVYVDRLVRYQRGQDEADIGVRIGSRLPASCTAMGKVLLAHLPEDERRELLSRAILERRGPNTIIGKRALLDELKGVLEKGFATENEEVAMDLVAIAAPVRDESKAVVVAIDLSAHAAKITVEQLADGLGFHLIAAADRISARMGHRREDEVAARG